MDDGQAVSAPALGSRRIFAPEPETKTATLYASAGRWTRHTFVRAERLGDRAWAYIFRCDETGAERRWGLESA